MPTKDPELKKTPSGVKGLDEVTNGGLPVGRPTLVCGTAGCGKTLMAVEFLANGAASHNEPGVFMMFEESAAELSDNVRSLGLDLQELEKEGRILMDHVQVDRSQLEETGEFDLDGLFIRLEHAVRKIGAKRVVLDTLDALFTGFSNEAVLRAELRRLFRWLKDRGLTVMITAEKGAGPISRHGLEEYVADCVIVLDHRVKDQISTRRLRVVKYRGSAHGTNEYPFIIGDSGISVLPITSLQLDHAASRERVSTGIVRLDEMLEGKGVYRGSSVLISGTPGTGKSTTGVMFAHAACARGEHCVLFSYEESPEQLIRNMGSIGVDLRQWIDKGLLMLHSTRPTLLGLEQHLVHMHDVISGFDPQVVVVDPISNFTPDRDEQQVKPMLMRLIDLLKKRNITGVFTSLAHGSDEQIEDSQVGVSSLMDTWILLRNMETNGERTRTLYILKSRGMAHSNQVREFVLSSNGVDLVDVYLGTGKVLTGTARRLQENADRATEELRQQEHEHRLKQLMNSRKELEARIASLKAQLEAEHAEVDLAIMRERLASEASTANTAAMAHMRDGGVNKRGPVKE